MAQIQALVKAGGLTFTKDAKKVFDILYPSGIKFKYKNLINRVYGEEVRLIGFGA